MGMWQGILQGMQLNEERERLARKERIEEEDRLFLREKYNQQLLDSRMKSILELRQKRAAAIPNESEYASELLAIKNRLGDYGNTEEGRRWYNTLRLQPEKSKEILSLLEESERQAAEDGIERDFRGQKFVETFQVLSDADPDTLDRFLNNGGDPYDAIIGGDIDITTDEGYMQALYAFTQPVPKRPTVAVAVSPTAFRGLDEARFKAQLDILDSRVVETAENEIARLTALANEATDDTTKQEFTTEATAIKNAINDFETNPTRLRRMYGPQVLEETTSADSDFFSLAEENPYLDPYRNLLPTPPSPVEGDVKTFNSNAEANAAFAAGELKDGDTFMVNGQRFTVGAQNG